MRSKVLTVAAAFAVVLAGTLASYAQSTRTSSDEGRMNEEQKRGPNVSTWGPDSNGTYVVTKLRGHRMHSYRMHRHRYPG